MSPLKTRLARGGCRGALLRALFWESIQNLPLVAGFLLGLDAWQSGRWGLAVAWAVGGSALGALAIWATEARIVEGHREPFRVVLSNALVMGILSVAVIAYLSSAWSRWWTDLVAGSLAALLLGVSQDLAAGAAGKEGIDWGHCAALALAFGCTLLGVRVLVAFLPPVANILVVTALSAMAVVLIDYGRPDPGGSGS